MEAGFRDALEPHVTVHPMRLGQVSSLRVAYHNAARMMPSRDSLMLFVHQDIVPATLETISNLPPQLQAPLKTWIEPTPNGPAWWVILRKLAGQPDFGFAGVAGSCEMTPGRGWWQHEKLSGMVLHRRTEGLRVNAYGGWSRVLVVDGLLMAARAGTVLDQPPRSGDPDHFHFYDMDFCLSAHHSGLKNWTLPLLVLHDSGGASASDAKWQTDMEWFLEKHHDRDTMSVPDEPLPGMAA